MKKLAIMVIALMMLTGFAAAAYLPPETDETQGITTYLAVVCDGTVFEKEQVSICASNEANPLTPPLSNGEVVSVSGYSQSLLAGHGMTAYEKSLYVDSSNALDNEYNIESSTQLTFDAGNNGGGAIFREDVLEVGVSTGEETTIEGDKTLCVFAEPDAEDVVYPAFCNYAEAGTNMMVTSVNMQSTSGTRSIAAVYDIGAALDYGITADGVGAITVHFDAIDFDSRTAQVINDKVRCCKPTVDEAHPSSITEYQERTTAVGTWDLTKIIAYRSGL